MALTRMALFGSWTSAWVAGVMLYESTTFLHPSQLPSSGVILYEATGWNTLTSTFVSTSDTRFLYDGWNLIAEFEMNLQSQILHLKSSHAWGLDLSGAETGAGGVGGLVFTKLYSQPSTQTPLSTASTLAPCYDGNGNVLAYIDLASGQVQARYEYDPFGKRLMAEESPLVAGRLHHQFSTKYFDAETGLSYYGYRYYSADLGRWMAKDPIGERGGINLYGMVDNDLLKSGDFLGLSPWDVYAAWGKAVEQFFKLCDDNKRCDGWILNNIGSSLGMGYCGCVEQAQGLYDELTSQPPNDNYSYSGGHSGGSGAFQHNWVEGNPNDPTDPTISMDLSKGVIIITHANGMIETWYLYCKPRHMHSEYTMPDGTKLGDPDPYMIQPNAVPELQI